VNAHASLTVRLYGDRVGYISKINDRYVFSFTPDYLALNEPPTLSRSFIDASGHPRSQTRLEPSLPGFFENLLPENRLRDYIAGRAGISRANSFGLLHATGDDLPGAVTIDRAGELVADEDTIPPEYDHPLRFSLAGVQLKFSAIRDAGGGFTIPVDGVGGQWILKLPPLEFARVPENELASLDFARACGIDVPETMLVKIADIEGLPHEFERISETFALAVKRFDRAHGGKRIHIEDFNQVFNQPPSQKYDNHDFSSLAKYFAVKVGADSLQAFLRRLAFSIAIGNGDMHLKNWSLIYHDRVLPSISPAYDFVPTSAYMRSDDLGLKFGRTRRAAGLTDVDLAVFAEKADISKKLVFEAFAQSIERIRDEWRAFSAGAPEILAASVTNALERVPLLAKPLRPLHAVNMDLKPKRGSQ
jgi:serine/threonine-protein kinase HipA